MTPLQWCFILKVFVAGLGLGVAIMAAIYYCVFKKEEGED